MSGSLLNMVGISADAVIIVAVVLAFVLFGTNILFGILFGKAAKQKGYSGGGAFVLVFFFGILGGLYVVALPDRIAQQQRDALIRMQMGQFQPQPLQHGPQPTGQPAQGPQPQQPTHF